ncbi:MAG: prepilin-type N-terminal cleavage/methylation domain-containing protein [Acidobacteria bacterium]|jgi:type II secretory pathway pseudopilin PulG|nr:prepilin-type N-terminal cleavage/methylation domain-containing protein [Acidobacteriota bacterium]
MRTRFQQAISPSEGFTLLEVLVTIGIIIVLSGITVAVMPVALISARSDSSAATVVAVMRVAREEAISQRRNMQVVFTAPNKITVSRIEVPGPGTTLVREAFLGTNYSFMLFVGVPDTPDAFGNATATAFPGATSILFTSSGELVDQGGDPVNGTIFIGRTGETLSARAVSIFGPTALIRQWRWAGSAWAQ